MTFDDREAPFHQANALLGARRFHEALAVLLQAREEAERTGDTASAAFYSSVIGSFLASRGRDEEALESYLSAETYDPGEASWRLSTGNHLLTALNRALEARQKAVEVLTLAQQNPALEHAAHSLLGLAELALENEQRAATAFSTSISMDLISGLRARQCDLRLVEDLIRRNTNLTDCRSYLAILRQKAEAEEDIAVQQALRLIEERHHLR